MNPLDLIEGWPVGRAAAASIAPDGSVTTFGDIDRVFQMASLTKLMTALSVLIAVEEGSVALDDVATDWGATVADLLSHSGGMAPDSYDQVTRPRTRRVYSTSAYNRLGEVVAARTGMAFPEYLETGVFQPLAMTQTVLYGSPGAESTSTVRDLISLTSAWREPILVHDSTLAGATEPVAPELGGVLPGFGRFDHNQWGLGPELKGTKEPHWTGPSNSASTFGHFGRAGSMLWIDPVSQRTLIALADEPFGPWAKAHWPLLSEEILQAG